MASGRLSELYWFMLEVDTPCSVAVDRDIPPSPAPQPSLAGECLALSIGGSVTGRGPVSAATACLWPSCVA